MQSNNTDDLPENENAEAQTQQPEPAQDAGGDVDVEGLMNAVQELSISEGAKEQILEGVNDLTHRLHQAESASEGYTESLDSVRKQADNYKDEALRAQAEVQNTRRIAQREMENALRFGQEHLVLALLDVLDNMERALESLKGADESLSMGVELTSKSLIEALGKVGVAVMDALDQPFDPERHEALSYAPSDTATADSVMQVIQQGYMLHDRVIRPARVIIARTPQPEPATQDAAEEETAEDHSAGADDSSSTSQSNQTQTQE